MQCRPSKLISILLIVGATICGGCSVSIPIDLEEAGLNEFDVTAGEPADLKGLLTVITRRTVGSANLRIALEDISIIESGGEPKPRSALQEVNACLDACAAAEVAADVCEAVCVQNILLITVWIKPAADVNSDCATGDPYVFEVTLDDAGIPLAITVMPERLLSTSESLLNEGPFGVCIQVISPFNGTVFIDALIFNVGL